MKDDISQNIHQNMIFSVCSIKRGFTPTNMNLPFCQTSKDDVFPKNTPKDDISNITEKDDIHPGKDDIYTLD